MPTPGGDRKLRPRRPWPPDERIVDGYYYAAFFKHYKRILAHPEILDRPPEEVLKDID